jgi:hypothetical protein
MDKNRRTFLQLLPVFCLESALARKVFSEPSLVQQTPEDRLKSILRGSWKLESYTYTSNNRTYSPPDEMEAVANFAESQYDVSFSTHIARMGIKRTRNASESGTYLVSGDRIRLFAEEASSDREKGEEFLTDVSVEDDTMKLTSNNGGNHEVWKKVS